MFVTLFVNLGRSWMSVKLELEGRCIIQCSIRCIKMLSRATNVAQTSESVVESLPVTAALNNIITAR